MGKKDNTMNPLERLFFRITREPNVLTPGKNTTLSYTKPIEEWSIEERDKWDNLVAKDPIVGLERRVMSTLLPEKEAKHNEVFENAQKEITKMKFES